MFSFYTPKKSQSPKLGDRYRRLPADAKSKIKEDEAKIPKRKYYGKYRRLFPEVNKNSENLKTPTNNKNSFELPLIKK